MKQDYDIIAARPDDAKVNTIFTDAVMARVSSKKVRKSKLFSLLRTSPLFAVLAGIIVVSIVSGTVYALSYLWPKLSVLVSSPSTTTSGRQVVQVIANDCPDVSNKRYELKKVAPFGANKIPDVVKAECNMESIQKWANETYPEASFVNSHMYGKPDMTPGKVFEGEKTMNYSLAYKVQAISSTSITFEKVDQWNPDKPTQKYSPNTKFIVDHQYGKWSDIHPGDAVAYISIMTSTVRNNDNCTSQSCGNTTVSSTEELMAVVKLDMPFDDYNKFGSLAEIIKCQDNEKDDCHTGNVASIEIYAPSNANMNESQEMGVIEGVVQSHTSSATVIKTTSGRLVTLATSIDLLQSFNTKRSAEYNVTAGVGDMIQVMYGHNKGVASPSTISQNDILSVMLTIEINSKADLTEGATTHKY